MLLTDEQSKFELKLFQLDHNNLSQQLSQKVLQKVVYDS